MMLSCLLVLLYITIILSALKLAPRDAGDIQPAVSGFSIVLVLSSIYVAMPSVFLLFNHAEFTWAPGFGGAAQLSYALAVSIIGIAFFILGYTAMAHKSSSKTASCQVKSGKVVPAVLPSSLAADPRGRSAGRRLAWCLLGAGLVLKLLYILLSGGLQTALLRMSGGTAAATGVGEASPLLINVRVVSGVADGAATWLFVQAYASGTRRARRLYTLLLVITLAANYLISAKRLALLLPILVVAVAVQHYVKRYTVKIVPLLLLAAISFGMLTLFARIYLPAMAAGSPIYLTRVPYAEGSILKFYFNSLEFSTMEMIGVTIFGQADILQLMGGRVHAFFVTAVTPLLYLVPRSIWPGKPTEFTDFSYAISSILVGRPLEEAGVGYVSTLTGTSYVIGGAYGVAVSFLAFGAMVAYIDRRFMARLGSPTSIVFYGIALDLVFHYFRMGSIGWTFLIGVTQQLGFLLAIVAIIFASGRQHRSGSPQTRLPPWPESAGLQQRRGEVAPRVSEAED